MPRMRQAAAPPPIAKREQGISYLQLTIKLLTPLFGGGVKPGENDPKTPIRGTAVRGQLRFWWRAMRGGFYETIAELKAAEALLWGTASNHQTGSGPSAVSIRIPKVSRGTPLQAVDEDGRPVDNIGKPQSIDSYVAFPLRELEGATVQLDVSFDLELRYPTAWPTGQDNSFAGTPAEEIEAAVWAWTTFGGIGARTRRGFGALQVTHRQGERVRPPDQSSLENWIQESLELHVIDLGGVWLPDLPHLSQSSRFKVRAFGDGISSLSVWRALVNRLKEFRQQRTPGTPGNPRPGRSRWPEADELRRATGDHAPLHAPEHDLSGIPYRFPRAAFGLPLILQFKGDDVMAGDPRGTFTVEGMNGRTALRRLASPVLLRPLAVTTPNGVRYVGLAIRLEGIRLPLTLTLSGGRLHGATVVTAVLTAAEFPLVRNANKTAPLLNDPDVITAFLNWL